MGGAAIAVVNDETALLLNPAGLGKLRSSITTIFDPEIHGNANISKNYNAVLGRDPMNPQALLDWANSARGEHFHGKLQVFPSYVTTNFGIGLLGKYSYDGEVDSTGTTYRMDYTNDFALAMGYNLRLFDGIVKIGTSLRLVNRIEVAEDIAATTTNLSWSQIQREGVGAAADVGLIVTAPYAWLPSIAAVWRDAGNTSFSVSQGLFRATRLRPRDVEQTIDAAFSVSPIIGGRTRIQITGEYRDVKTASQETDHMRRTHAGLEINIRDALFLRGGMNQRYWTAGLELAISQFQLQAASYGEEIGTSTASSTTTREDRRYVVKFAVRF